MIGKLIFVFGALIVGGCGGAHLSARQYSGPDTHYRVGSLSNVWQRLEVDDQNHFAWNHKRTSAVIQVNARCGRALDLPIRTLRNHLLIGFTNVNVLSEQMVPLANREALRTKVQAKLDGVERALDLIVLKKDQCVYDFALITPPQPNDRSVSNDFEQFIKQFQTLRKDET